MSKQSGLGDNFYIGGYDLSGNVGSLSNIHGGLAGTLDVTPINKSAFVRLGGERDGGIEFSSWFDKAAGAEHAALSGLPTGQRLAIYCRGTGIGLQAACCWSRQINYDPNRGQDGSLALATSVQADGYGLEWGEQLTAGIRTDTTATNGTAFDAGASSTFGGQIYLEVFSVTGTSVTVKLQDSADNATFADLTGAAFTAATGRSEQRIQLSNTATVRRYVRAVSSGTFTNAQFAVVFVRNPIAGVTF